MLPYFLQVVVLMMFGQRWISEYRPNLECVVSILAFLEQHDDEVVVEREQQQDKAMGTTDVVMATWHEKLVAAHVAASRHYCWMWQAHPSCYSYYYE